MHEKTQQYYVSSLGFAKGVLYTHPISQHFKCIRSSMCISSDLVTVLHSVAYVKFIPQIFEAIATIYKLSCVLSKLENWMCV